ncbi:hypothetical protein SAMN05421541_10612 [Actinoplanes philippinensis]|uniref:Uncharacterized protein n=1 Tax=Actinoplanes philippinensis TaxID=35752 RepID=A0A1I2FYN4_9ACTN|nr:hypothetical protein SAMN05421541_10612 [Actinoplanes philippinensis]
MRVDLIERARPYLRELMRAPVWSAAAKRRLYLPEEGPKPPPRPRPKDCGLPPQRAERVLPPERTAQARAALLLNDWEQNRLDAMLAAPGVDDEGEEVGSGPIMTALEHLAIPAAEAEAWIRGPFGGNIAAVDHLNSWWISYARTAHPGGAAVAVVSAALGDPEPAENLRYHPRNRSLPEEAWRPLIEAGGQRVTAEYPEAGSQRLIAAELLSRGWTVAELRRQTDGLDGPDRNRLLHCIDGLRFIPYDEILTWLEAMTPADLSRPDRWRRLSAVPQLRTLVGIWRSTGLPPATRAWCAAAGLAPEEAITADDLDLDELKAQSSSHSSRQPFEHPVDRIAGPAAPGDHLIGADHHDLVVVQAEHGMRLKSGDIGAAGEHGEAGTA